jgi:hypothetical protein
VAGPPATRFHRAVEHNAEHALTDGIERVRVRDTVNEDSLAGGGRTPDPKLFARHGDKLSERARRAIQLAPPSGPDDRGWCPP